MDKRIKLGADNGCDAIDPDNIGMLQGRVAAAAAFYQVEL